MSRKQIEAVIRKAPLLTIRGMGNRQEAFLLPRDERRKLFEEDQKSLFGNPKEFRKACQWWATKQKQKTINRRHSSYELKHMAEKEIGYVTNGTFIAAAIHCGFDWRMCSYYLNVAFNVSEKSLISAPLALSPNPFIAAGRRMARNRRSENTW